MNFLNEEQILWRNTVYQLMEKQIGLDYVRKCDMDRAFPYEGYDKITKAGWWRLLIPEEAGGDGGSIFDYALMCEGLARYGFDFATGGLGFHVHSHELGASRHARSAQALPETLHGWRYPVFDFDLGAERRIGLR